MAHRRRNGWTLALLALAVLAGGCGDRDGDDDKKESEQHEQSEDQLTPFQLEHGIGPVTAPVVLGPLDPALVKSGQEVFEAKCTGCHKMESVYVGPALGEVTRRRTGAFIMNMILNPQEMVEHHPVAKQMLAERMSYMANQNLTVEQARAVLEYLRTQAKGANAQ